MENKFLKNLEGYLLNNNFFNINTNIETNVYFKNIGTNGCLVVPILKDEKYKEIFDQIEIIVQNILKKNDIGKVFVVKILVSKTFEIEDDVFFSEELELDEKIININWGVDLSNNEIISKGKQPDKLLNIEKYIKAALKGKVKKKKKNYIVSKSCSVTYSLIFMMVLVHIVVIMNFERDDIIYNFGISPNLFTDRQYYRLFTFLFLHSGLTHLLSNLLSLYIFGVRIERYLGKVAFLLIFFTGGVASALFSIMFTQKYSIGASGAIFALQSATFYFAVKEKVMLDGLDYYTIGLIVMVGIIGSSSNVKVDNAGHLGGFFMGFIVCAIYYNTIYKLLIKIRK